KAKHDQDATCRRAIAQILAQFHSLQVPTRRNVHHEKVTRVLGNVWFDEQLERETYSGSLKQMLEAHKLTNILGGNLRAELNFVMNAIRSGERPGQIVYCHRDFNHNNILVQNGDEPEKRKIFLIDFDYCFHFYRGKVFLEL